MVRPRARIKIIARIRRRTLKIPPTASMEIVGARLHHHVDDRAAVIAKLRREAVVLDLELLHRLHRWLVIHVRVAALTLFRRAQRAAIKTDFGRGIPLSIRYEVSS